MKTIRLIRLIRHFVLGIGLITSQEIVIVLLFITNRFGSSSIKLLHSKPFPSLTLLRAGGFINLKDYFISIKYSMIIGYSLSRNKNGKECNLEYTENFHIVMEVINTFIDPIYKLHFVSSY